MMEDKSCGTCRWYLGGVYACCRLNLEKECREGIFEAWEDKRKERGEKDESGNSDR